MKQMIKSETIFLIVINPNAIQPLYPPQYLISKLELGDRSALTTSPETNPKHQLPDIEPEFLADEQGQMAGHDFGQGGDFAFAVRVLQPDHLPGLGVEQSPRFGGGCRDFVF